MKTKLHSLLGLASRAVISVVGCHSLHAYDRSPCRTGTSDKLACLAADDQEMAEVRRKEAL